MTSTNTTPRPQDPNHFEAYGREGLLYEQALAIAGCTGHNIERLRPKNTTAALEAAMGDAIFLGWKTFPADVENKKSYLSAEYAPGHEPWGMTNDLEQLRRNFVDPNWRTKCGVGVPTGWVNRIFDIEGDTKKGHGVDGLASIAVLEAEHETLPLTRMAVSPSGSVHRIYNHPGRGIKVRSSTSELGPGIDVKGDGGMFIAPPSVRSDGAYKWLNNLPIADAPDWLIELVRDDAPAQDSSDEKKDDPFSQYADEHRNVPLAKIAFMLSVIPNDDVSWEEWNDLGMASWHGAPNDDGLALFDKWSQPSPKYKKIIKGTTGKQRTAEKWKKYFKNPPTKITVGKLFYLADQADPDWRNKYHQAGADNAAAPVVIVRAADVKMRPMEWIWKGHLARGALELTTGLPGLGKSQVQICFMACASAGLPWPDEPDGARAIDPVDVIMATAEDAIDTQVVPRLTAAGADLNRIHIVKCIKTDKLQRQFLLAEDLEKLEQVIKQIGNVGLVCLDPITAYMGGKMDSHKATEVRSQLGPLKDFSERANVALSAITHPAKNASAKAIDHFIGSQAFIAAARIGHACFEEFEEDEEAEEGGSGEKTPTGRILFTNVKYSAHVKMPTLAYRIESTTLYPEPFVQIGTSRVVWDKEAVDISAEQAIAAGRQSAKGKTEEAASDEVVRFLGRMLEAGDGWCKQTEIAAQAKALGFSDKELRTARKKLGVSSKKEGFDGPWLWGWEGKRPPRILFP